MNIDDIYTAAVDGDKDTLISLLEADEVNINELIDCGVCNGIHIHVPALYSILSEMNDNGCYNYEILDILIQYGMNINECVIHSTDAYKYRIPIIFCAIRDWSSPELVRFFMERGARPASTQIEQYADGHEETYPLIYMAIQHCDDCEILKTVLEYGASPNDYVHTYYYEQAMTQVLPVIYYALVDRQSLEKCIWLFRYGASIDTYVYPRPGKGFQFDKYISRYYSGLSDMLRDAYKAGKNKPMKPKYVYPEDFMTRRGGPVTPQKPAAEENKSKLDIYEANDGFEKLRNMAIDLMTLDKTKKKLYLNALKDSKTNPGFFDTTGKKKKKSAEAFLSELYSYRKTLVEKLNQLDSSLTGGSRQRWWNDFNGLDFNPVFPSELLVWTPFKRVTMGPEMLKLMPHCTATSTITGQQLELLIKSGDVAPIYKTALDAEKEYSFAELCFWEIFDATEIETTVTSAYSDREISSALADRSRSMNDFEGVLNTITGKGNFTDDELFSFGKMKTSDYFNSRNARNYLLNEYEEKMRNATETKTVIKNQKFFEHHYSPVGVIAFDENEKAAAILTYTEPRQSEVYTVNFENNIYKSKQGSSFGEAELIRTYALRSLDVFPISAPDIIAEQPEYLTEKEWFDFIYHCIVIDDSDRIKQEIERRYQIAGINKQNKIHNAPFL